VERLVSAANLVHQDSYHEQELERASSDVNVNDTREISTFLDESGRLDDASGVYGSEAYRELIYRRKQGATDADLNDLVGDLTAEMNASQGTDLASAVVFSDDVENRIGADGPPEHHEHNTDHHSDTDPDRPHSRRSAEDLGWA
jgi:hypothetical protein